MTVATRRSFESNDDDDDDDDDDDRARRSRDALSTRRARNIATTTDDRRPASASASASASADVSVRHLDDRRNGTSFRGARGGLWRCVTQRKDTKRRETQTRGKLPPPVAGERDAIERRGPNPSEERVARELTTGTSVMPPKRAKTTKKTEKKKENPKAIVEEEYAPTASDGEEDEDEEDLDGEEGDEDVLMVRAVRSSMEPTKMSSRRETRETPRDGCEKAPPRKWRLTEEFYSLEPVGEL
jgi:hypothetical protein